MEEYMNVKCSTYFLDERGKLRNERKTEELEGWAGA